MHQDEVVIVVAVQYLAVARVGALLAVDGAGQAGVVAVVEAGSATDTLLAVRGEADSALRRAGAEQAGVVAQEVEGRTCSTSTLAAVSAVGRAGRRTLQRGGQRERRPADCTLGRAAAVGAVGHVADEAAAVGEGEIVKWRKAGSATALSI